MIYIRLCNETVADTSAAVRFRNFFGLFFGASKRRGFCAVFFSEGDDGRVEQRNWDGHTPPYIIGAPRNCGLHIVGAEIPIFGELLEAAEQRIQQCLPQNRNFMQFKSCSLLPIVRSSRPSCG